MVLLPLIDQLERLEPKRLHYLGMAYGLSQELYKCLVAQLVSDRRLACTTSWTRSSAIGRALYYCWDLSEKSIKQNMPYLDGCFMRKFNEVFLLELSNDHQCFGMMFSR